MSTEAQTLANRRLGRRIVLNLGHFDFEIVSDFDIRISDFNHSGCFMQNKPNLPAPQMNVTSFYTKDYENERLCRCVKTNPIQTQYKANTNPIPEMSKMNVTSILTKDYENETAFALRRNKPNQTQFVVSKVEPPVVSLPALPVPSLSRGACPW